MGLQKRLDALKEEFTANVPDDALAVMNKETEKLLASDIISNVIKVGEELPDGTLTAMNGGDVKIDRLLNDKPLVISFYRGGWCPYCNLELKALESIANEIKALGANIIAMSPESIDHIRETKNNNGVSFDVYSDEGSRFAKELGLVFTLPKALQDIYLSFGIDVEKHNGESKFELPIPTTLILKPNKEIVYIFADGDYSKRSEPTKLLEVLKSL
jgi:peroxiredoxin